MDAMKIANGLPMWIACGIPVCMVLIQAITFFKKAYAAGEKVDLTKGQMKEAIRSAAITSIGPSIVVLSGMLSLLITVGGPVAWMRLSCASMAQVAANVEPGTEKGSIIATLGMAVSIVINVSVLTIGVILGSSILSKLPASFTNALNYLLPALFGALLMQFALKQKKLSVTMVVFAILMNVAIKAGVFTWLPGSANYLGTLSCVFVAIFLNLKVFSKKEG